MLVSHSPPVFSHSPPDYAATLNLPSRTTQHSNLLCRRSAYLMAPTITKPTRPCLVIRRQTIDDQQQDDTFQLEEPSSPNTRNKKKVVFADDRGMSLTHVRVMSEPSNVPPMWTRQFFVDLTAVQQRLKQNSNGCETQPWKLHFAQPASDYVAFRNKLESNKVCLENVIVRNDVADSITGTIKVCNVAFEKEVFLRTTQDNWATNEDVYCTYVENNLKSTVGAAYILYDTFSFKINLQPNSWKLEFCVCFRCNGTEFWDSNNGSNYVLMRDVAVGKQKRLDEFRVQSMPQDIPVKTQTKIDTWTQFASWSFVDNATPYW